MASLKASQLRLARPSLTVWMPTQTKYAKPMQAANVAIIIVELAMVLYTGASEVNESINEHKLMSVAIMRIDNSTQNVKGIVCHRSEQGPERNTMSSVGDFESN